MGNSIKQSTIEINGRSYDARTGKLLDGAVATTSKAPATPRRSMDVAPRTVAGKHVHKTVERSKTLMRHAVKKPAAPSSPKPKKSGVLSDIAAPVKPSVSAGALYHQTDAEREKRAKNIKRSNLVSRFSDFAASATSQVHHDQPVPSRIEPLAVKPAPDHAATHHVAQKSKAHSVLEQGLRAAKSHTEPSPAKSRRSRGRHKLASFGAGALAVLLLGGFFAYQNIPQVSMRYAAARAGVDAQLPGYRPSGFALNNRIQYNPGQITLSFKSNADERNFTITQRSSNWNSEALMSNYVSQASEQVQTYEDKGRTIYLYGDSNATWVNGGVWYDINGNSQLNSDQLVRIASSM